MVAGILNDPGRLDEVLEILDAPHFYDADLRVWFSHLSRLKAAGSPLDEAALASSLRASGVARRDLLGTILSLTTSAGAPLHAAHHARRVREMADRRALIAAGGDLIRLGHDLSRPVDELRGEAFEALGPPTGKTGDAPPAFTRLISAAELLGMDLRPRFLVRGVLVDGQPMVIGGRSKTLKTSVACDLALSLASGTPFLGRFDSERVPVAFWSGESGAATIRETAIRIARSKDIDLLRCDVSFCFDLPRLSQPRHVEHVARTIEQHGVRVAFLDPLYLCLLDAETAGAASNQFAMGAAYGELTALGRETGCTIILLHHFRKSGVVDEENPCSLEELALAGAAEWARQWILLQRRIPYQADGVHSLWARCGGSAGHASLWGLTVDEGLIDPDTFSGRRWDVTVTQASDARQEARRDRELRKAADQERREAEQRDGLLTVLRKFPTGETQRVLSAAARLNASNFGRAITALLQEGRAEQCQVLKKGATYEGFKSTGK